MAAAPHDLRIALLGPLVVEVGDQTVEVPGGHRRRLLAALALAPGRVVSTDSLVYLLWGDDPPASARNSLQSHLTRLRRCLGRAQSVVREHPGYRLCVAADAVDAVAFERLVDEATHTPQPAGRRRLLDRALALWRADEPSALAASGLTEDASRLVRRRVAAQVDRAAMALEGRDLVTAEADALAVLRIDPFHEPAVVLLVRVLAATGRTAEADTTIQRFRDRLGDGLGLDPSPALEEIHTALLRGQLPQVTAAAPPSIAARSSSAPDRSTSAEPGRLRRPALPRSSFRGRRRALDELAEAVASRRCVTVVGPGGVGKTRLAVEFAHRQRRDVVWADLLDARTGSDVLGRLALAAGCGTPSDPVVLSPLAEALTASEALVVLDNCEQAVAEVAAVVDALLHATRATTVLATSRTPLAVDGERVVDVAPLPTTTTTTTTTTDGGRSVALQLFADRVGRALDLDDPGRRRIATDLVVALDGLPLAIELAARQARNLGLEAVRDRLDNRLELLETGRPGDHPAHADLRSLVRWSTDLLDEPERRAFCWLSVFGGSFTLAQAEQLLGAEGAAVPAPAAAVARLVEQSLVERRPSERFVLLETLRACGAEELERAGETAAARTRHTDLVITAAEAARASFGTDREIAAVAELNAMVADLQAATDRLEADRDLEGLCSLACAVREYAYETQRPELLRAARVAARLLADGAGSTLPTALRDGATVAAAVEAAARGDLDAAQRLVAPVLVRDVTSPATGPAWNVLGDTRLWMVEPRAEDAYRQAVRTSELAGDQFMAATGLTGLALALTFVGDVAAARREVAELERRAERRRSPLLAAWAAYARAETEADHDPEAALAAYGLAIDRGRGVGAHLVVAAASSGAAAVRARHGDPASVLPHVRNTLRELRGSGNANVRQSVLRNVSVLLTRMGSDDAAAILLGATSTDTLYEAERRRIGIATEALVERLGGEVVERRRARGARMDPGDVVDVALDAVEALLAR